MLVKYIGNSIRTRRKELGITQPLLGELAEVSKNTIYKLERGDSNITADVLGKILEVLGLELKISVRKN